MHSNEVSVSSTSDCHMFLITTQVYDLSIKNKDDSDPCSSKLTNLTDEFDHFSNTL